MPLRNRTGPGSLHIYLSPAYLITVAFTEVLEMSTATLTDAGRGLWTIDPAHTQAEFGVRHMMISTVRGRFAEVAGTITVDPDDLASTSVDVRIGANSIDTGNEDRDKHLRSADFFDVESHPEITFRSSRVNAVNGRLEVHGDLTIRGTTREVVLDAEELGAGLDPWGQQRVAFRGETRINRKDFGLTWNQALEAGGVLVGDEVRITLEVQAIAASSED